MKKTISVKASTRKGKTVRAHKRTIEAGKGGSAGMLVGGRKPPSSPLSGAKYSVESLPAGGFGTIKSETASIPKRGSMEYLHAMMGSAFAMHKDSKKKKARKITGHYYPY